MEHLHNEQSPDAQETANEQIVALGDETMKGFERKDQDAQETLTTSPLSLETKQSYLKRIEGVAGRYKEQVSKMRNAALVVLALNAASPAFAQEENTQQIDTETTISQTVADETPETVVTPQDNTQSETQTDEHTPEVTKKVEPLAELEISPNAPERSSIILNTLEQAAKSKLEKAKENPAETGLAVASKLAKGPVKTIANVIEIIQSIRDSSNKNESAADTAKKVGKLLINLKTFGMGSMVIDYLHSLSTKPD